MTMIRRIKLLAIGASFLLNGAFLSGMLATVYFWVRNVRAIITDATTNSVLRTRFKNDNIILMTSDPVGTSLVFYFSKGGRHYLFSWSRLKDENIILIDSGGEQVTFFDPLDGVHAHNSMRLLLRRNGSARPALFAVDGTGRFMPVGQRSSDKLVEDRQDKR